VGVARPISTISGFRRKLWEIRSMSLEKVAEKSSVCRSGGGRHDALVGQGSHV
jgi:hypothetical protein